MSQIEEANEQILTKILKTDQVYEALWGKEDFVPTSPIVLPNDYNCGAITNGLEYVYQFIREITEPDIELLQDPYIDIAIYFFTGLKRFQGESNTLLLLRMRALIVREGDWRSERFGTPWDLLNVFSYYITRSKLYYVPNHVITELLINGDFEIAVGAEWTFSPSGDRSIDDSFTGSYKLDFSAFTSVRQTIAVTSGPYILNGFIKPDSAPIGDTDILNIRIQRDSDSFYYNISTETWVAVEPTNTFSTEESDYSFISAFIVSDGSYNVTIEFIKIVDFLLDRVQFGEKEYPSFEILFVDSGIGSFVGSVWDAAETNYPNASYLDQDAMFSSAESNYSDDYYQELLDMIKAAGVEGNFVREVRL